MDWFPFCSRPIIGLNFQTDKVVFTEAGQQRVFDHWDQLSELELINRTIEVSLSRDIVTRGRLTVPLELPDEAIELELKNLTKHDERIYGFIKNKSNKSDEEVIDYAFVSQAYFMQLMQRMTSLGLKIKSIKLEDQNIYLYPSRSEQLHIENKIMQKIGWVTLSATILFIACVHTYQFIREEKINSQIEQLKINSTSELNNQDVTHAISEKNTLTTFLRSLNQLQSHHGCLMKLGINQNNIEISGYTRSSESLTQFLNNWQSDNAFSEIKINKLNQTPNQMIQFSVRALRHDV